MATYFQAAVLTVVYLHPREISLLVNKEGQNARILLVSNGHIEKLNQRDGILVIPSFFSVTHDNHICTFSWGDSDIIGSLIEPDWQPKRTKIHWTLLVRPFKSYSQSPFH
ncbi:hypothetical protein SCR05_01695 [Streptococcus canis]|uniref:hypothetical protein n=1 Tax=Streptococcus canis TaxID=1329 RepID=UPI00298E3BD6|nr:hypothetical protein [Streptococcus canis]MDW7796342.1 hypothetical protein [Streptococcus canis]